MNGVKGLDGVTRKPLLIDREVSPLVDKFLNSNKTFPFLPEGIRSVIRDGAAKDIQAILDDLDEAIFESHKEGTLEDWLEGWEAAVEAGQSSISRGEAIRRWEKEYSE